MRWEQMNLAPPSPRLVNPDIPPALEAIILKCLEKEPSKRYSSALDLLNAVEQALATGQPRIATAPQPLPPPEAAQPPLPIEKSPLPAVQPLPLAAHTPPPAPALPPKRDLRITGLTSRRVGLVVVGIMGIAALILLGILYTSNALRTSPIPSSTVIPAIYVITPTPQSPKPTLVQPNNPTPVLILLDNPTLALTPSPSLIPQELVQLVVKDMHGEVEYSQNAGDTYHTLELNVPYTPQKGFSIMTKTNGMVRLLLNNTSTLYLSQNTSLTMEFIAEPSSDLKTVLQLYRGAILVDSKQVTVDTPTGQSVEIVGLMGVRFNWGNIRFQVDCLEGICTVTSNQQTQPIALTINQGISSPDWTKSTAECAFWEALASDRVKCGSTSAQDLTRTLTMTATPTVTPTKARIPNQLNTPTKTRKPSPTKTTYIPPPPQPTKTKPPYP